MNAGIVTTITAFAALLVALWTIMTTFDKRNQDRFESLQKQIDLRIESSKEVLRAEMREMRAEIRLEIREAADRRLIGK